MMSAILATAWLLAAAAPPAAAATPAPAAKAATDPVVCRWETPIGSKLSKKVCVRKSELDRQERESREALQLIQRRSLGPTTQRDP